MKSQNNKMPAWVPKAIIFFWICYVLIQVSTDLLSKLSSFITSVAVSLFLSFMIEPAVNWLHRKGWKRGVATSFVLLTATSIIMIFLVMMGNVIVSQTKDFIDSAPNLINTIEKQINNRFHTNFSADKLIKSISEKDSPLRKFTSDLAVSAFSFGGTALSLLLQFLTVALFTFYLVADAPKMRRSILRRLPKARQRVLMETWELAISKTGGYIYSRLLLGLASGIFHFIAFEIIGIKYAAAMAIWVGIVSQFIPVVGTYLAGALPILIALADSPMKALWAFVAIMIYQQIENFFVSPKITEKTMSLHPAISFASVLIGASVFGTVGAFIALPVAAMIQAYLSSNGQVHDIAEELNIDLDSQPSDSKLNKLNEKLHEEEDY